ncbi:MAG: c-type cytochrome, partial [Pedosphaera parvula]|nr:c-type cytochrome [Pedosphaera parvula]
PPTRGRVVYEELCMKCHGTDRFGVGMAPPLHRLKHRFNDDEVRQLLKTGRNGMPVAEGLKDEDVQPLLDYLFLRDVPAEALRDAPEGELRYTYNGYPKLLDPDGYPGCKPPWGTLNCIDLASGKLVWQVPLGVYPDLAEWGEDDTGAENFGGPTVTAGGVVFCAGAADNLIRGFDSATGAVLWEHKLPFGGYAPPAVYEVGGKEYVVIPATGGGKLGTEKGDAWVAFALP